MPVKPIKPSEVQKSVPDEIIEAFNELIAEKWNGREATVMQNKVVARILKKIKISKDKLFEDGMLDVEPIFRKAGWKVTYDKPGWDESYEPRFVFTK